MSDRDQIDKTVAAVVVGLVHFQGEAPTGISLYWVNSTGKIAIGTSEVRGRGRVGVMNRHKFKPLPGVAGSATTSTRPTMLAFRSARS